MDRQRGGRRDNRKRSTDDGRGGARTAGPGKKIGRPPTRWSGIIGQEAAAALSVMAMQDAVATGIEQEEAAGQLVARLILEERTRRLA